MTTTYPLQWPDGWPRAVQPENPGARFKRPTLAKARDRLLAELDRLGAINEVISSNLAPLSRGKVEDPGVAVYFQRGDRPFVMACDRWSDVASNLTSLALSIEGLRQMERHGSAHMMEKAFDGFLALPPPDNWRAILGPFKDTHGRVTADHIRSAYREKARAAHPDAGGSTEEMAKLNSAYKQALREVE